MTSTSAAPTSNRPARKLSPFVVFLSAGSVAAVLFLLGTGDWETAWGAPQATNGSTQLGGIHALARLEPADGLITIGISPGLRIDEVKVQSGDKVSDQQILAILDGSQVREQQLRVAEAQQSAYNFQRKLKEDQLHLARKSEDELQAARLPAQTQLVAILEDNLKLAESDLKRMVSGKLPQQQLDGQQSLVNQAKGALLDAKVKLRELQISDQLKASKRSIQDRELSDKNPELLTLERQVDLARANFEQSIVRAPDSGTIFKVIAHAGEVSSGPILIMGNTDAMVAIAEVYQSYAANIDIGDRADVLILGTTVKGTVIQVGALVSQNQLSNLDPTRRADRRVIEVRIRLDQTAPASKYVNMEVDVTLYPDTAKQQAQAAP